MNTYRTIASRGEGFFKDRGSKFFAFAFPVTTEEEIRQCQDELRKEYHDARHHCFAWVLGMKEVHHRANDDGEPAHSAGDPILGQIRSLELTNVLVVVVRYFGGTKLGVAGLINAYRTAAAEALQDTSTVEVFPEVEFIVQYDYSETNEAERLLAAFPMRVLSRSFESDCQVRATIHEELFPKLVAAKSPTARLTIKLLTE